MTNQKKQEIKNLLEKIETITNRKVSLKENNLLPPQEKYKKLLLGLKQLVKLSSEIGDVSAFDLPEFDNTGTEIGSNLRQIYVNLFGEDHVDEWFKN